MLKEYKGLKPRVHPSAYIADNAVLIGEIFIGENSSVWPGSVLRADVEEIIIKENTNLQDGVIVHTNYDLPAIIGKNVTVGHGAILHGCVIGDNCLIGMGAIVLDGAQVGENCIIGAGAVVTENISIEPGSLVLGIPGRITRALADDEIKKNVKTAQEYIEFAKAAKSS